MPNQLAQLFTNVPTLEIARERMALADSRYRIVVSQLESQRRDHEALLGAYKALLGRMHQTMVHPGELQAGEVQILQLLAKYDATLSMIQTHCSATPDKLEHYLTHLRELNYIDALPVPVINPDFTLLSSGRAYLRQHNILS